MSYDRQEATEQPTTTRLRRAREEGQVARSSDLSSSLLSLVAIGFAFYWIPELMTLAKAFLSNGISFSTEDPTLLLMQSGTSLLQILWLALHGVISYSNFCWGYPSWRTICTNRCKIQRTPNRPNLRLVSNLGWTWLDEPSVFML